MKIGYRRINHVTLAVPAGQHEKVRAFYGGVLGLKEVERPDALNKIYDLTDLVARGVCRFIVDSSL